MQVQHLINFNYSRCAQVPSHSLQLLFENIFAFVTGFYNLLLLTAKRVRSGCFSVDTDELGNTKTEHSGTILKGIAGIVTFTAFTTLLHAR